MSGCGSVFPEHGERWPPGLFIGDLSFYLYFDAGYGADIGNATTWNDTFFHGGACLHEGINPRIFFLIFTSGGGTHIKVYLHANRSFE